MSTHQDLIPETHTRTSKKCKSKKCKRSPKKDLLDRGSREIFIQELPTSNQRELSYKHQCRASSKSYCKTSWGGFQQRNLVHLVGILVKCCQRPLHDLVQVLARRSSRGPGSWENLTGSPQKGLLLLEEILQDIDTRTSQEHPRKAFIQAPNCTHGSCKIFMQGPLREDLLRTAPQRERSKSREGCACDIKYASRRNESDLTRTKPRKGCATTNPAKQSKCTWTSRKGTFAQNFS